jgi:hypothetical protein
MTRPCLRTDELTWKEIIGGGVFGEAGRKEAQIWNPSQVILWEIGNGERLV